MALIIYRGHKGLCKISADRFADKRTPQHRIIKDGHINQDTEFTYVDFIPSFCKKVKDRIVYHSFSSLVCLANEWLHSHPGWAIVSCETVAQYHHKVVKDVEYSADVYTLRLWIKRSSVSNHYGGDDIIFWYKDFVPQAKKGGGPEDQFEALEDLIQGINEEIAVGRVNGKILQIETIKIGATDDWLFKNDATYISDGKTTRDMHRFTNVVIGIRVFFQIGDWLEDEIVLVDFVPHFDLTDVIGSPGPKHNKEKFSQLIEKASKWLSANRDLNFCNAQAVDIRIRGSDDSVETRRTWWMKQETDKMVRFLRIYCTKPNEMSQLMVDEDDNLSQLSMNSDSLLNAVAFDQRTFHETIDEWYKSFSQESEGSQLKKKISTLETVIVPAFIQDETGLSFQHSVDQTLLGRPMEGRLKYLFVAIRIYYQESLVKSTDAGDDDEG